MWVLRHSAQNMVALPTEIHRKINAFYSSKQQSFSEGLTVRQWLSTQSLEDQRKLGIKLLKQFGISQ